MVPDGKDTVLSRARIFFRADASLEIGTGHVMRCLTLANALRERGAECLFVCRPHPGDLMARIAACGHHVAALPTPHAGEWPVSAADPAHAHWLGASWEDDAAQMLQALAGEHADWLVVDHYALDHRWEHMLRPACNRLMVMDDLADRTHDCDLLLDPSLGRTQLDYAALVPDSAALLLGPEHALLRPEFAAARVESLARRTAPVLRHLLITMGGVDKDNATGRLLDALDAAALPPDLRIIVVMGTHAPWLQEVQARTERMKVDTHVRTGVKDMARLMTDSDLAIGAAGSTSWERCCLGLPTIQLVLAENQIGCAGWFERLGAAASLVLTQNLTTDLSQLIGRMDTDRLRDMAATAARICDGRGVNRIVASMREHSEA